MKHLDTGSVVYTMHQQNPPAVTVASGESISIRTMDCFGDKLLPEGATAADLDMNCLNPATGPIFVEGAKPGTTLKIEILDIQVDGVGINDIDPAFGVLGPQLKRSQFRKMPVKDGKIQFSDKLLLNCRPMIGVIGVAPAGEGVHTHTPGSHGGNMDCTLIGEGSTLYLPTEVPGGLLSIGDLHACMGDGEIGGCGLEIAGTVTLRASALPVKAYPFPVLATKEELCAIASEETVEQAWKQAVRYLHMLLVDETELTSEDAMMLLSLAGNLAICQTVNPLKTVRMTLPMGYAIDCGYRPW